MTDSDDPIFWKSGEDSVMIEAIETAQNRYYELLEALKGDIDIEESFVKLMLPGKFRGVEAEHVYVSDLVFEEGALFGIIDSDPQYTDEYRAGDKIPIIRDRVSDWMYVVNGKGTGGFTLRVMWAEFSVEEKNEYKWEPPFCWMELA